MAEPIVFVYLYIQWKELYAVEALVSGDPRDAKKVSFTGAGRLKVMLHGNGTIRNDDF